MPSRLRVELPVCPRPECQRVGKLLRAAEERITPKKRWTRHAYGRNEHGLACEPVDACEWCAEGAVLAELDLPARRAEGFGVTPPALSLLRRAAAICGSTVPQVNDADGHGAALELFDWAIQLAEEEA